VIAIGPQEQLGEDAVRGADYIVNICEAASLIEAQSLETFAAVDAPFKTGVPVPNSSVPSSMRPAAVSIDRQERVFGAARRP